MNHRVNTLRQKSLDTPVTLSHERAGLVTEFYKTRVSPTQFVPVQRAMCLAHILANKAVFVGNDELIVGERGPVPNAVPTYPEVCLHSISDLEILDSRPKVAYRVSEETKQVYRDEIIPFWEGKTIREKIFNSMTPEWKQCFDAGIFTEFQEQRSPGHTAGGSTLTTSAPRSARNCAAKDRKSVV